MAIYNKILIVGTETSDAGPAFQLALTLARDAGADLTFLDVADAVPDSLRDSLPSSLLEGLESAARERRTAVAAPLIEEALRAGIEVQAHFQLGSAFRTAIAAVLTGGYDLLIKTVDATSEHSRSTYGSTDKHLLRKCPCALWLVAPEAEPRPSRVLAAVNPDPREPEDNALSGDILRAAADIAVTLEGSELHVLHAWKVFGEFLLRGPTPVVSDPEADFIVGQTLTRHARNLDDLFERVPLTVKPHRHLVHARAAEAIIHFIETQAVTLLVIGTVGRTGVSGLLIGNTAEHVLSEVACSVLALKPRGFVTPLAQLR